MALSGSKTVGFCSRNGANRYYLKYTWSATQNIANNTSTVTVKAYIGSYGNGYAINSSATKSGSITIDGTTYSISSLTSISSGGSRQIWSGSKTITHASDGTKSFSISLSFNPAVTISGTYQGNASTGSTSFTLNTIPRVSSISSNGNWTFPGSKTVTISRKSSSMTHTVIVYVNGTEISRKTGVGTSCTFSFTDAENTKIATQLAQASSKSTEIRVITYYGSSNIGTASKTGTVSINARSTTSFTNNWNIGATISGKVTRSNSKYTHTIQLLRSDASTVIFTMLNKSTTINWTYTPTASTLYALTPNANSYTGRIRIYTYFNGVQVGSYAQSNITWKVTNSNPTFTPTLSYKDINTTITGKTSNDQYIVQGKSNLRVSCVVSSTTLKANNSATLKTLQCTVAGVTKTINYSSSTTTYNFDFGTVNATSNQSAVVKAVDSRGNSTSKTVTVLCVPYTAPKLTAKVERANKFSTQVNIDISGTYSLVSVAGANKNSLTTTYFTYGVDGGSQGSQNALTLTTSGTAYYTSTPAKFTLSETSIATVEIKIGDNFGGLASATVSVPTGLPIMFIDAEKGNISFNALPDMTKEANMNLGVTLDTAPNQYWTSDATQTMGNSYGINMHNSDLVGLGGIFFNDICEAKNNNEGIFFINSGNMTTCGWNGTTRLYARDGQLWIGTGTGDANGRGSRNNPYCVGHAKAGTPIADVGMYMTGGHTVTPSISLYNCPTGWLLAWSDYDRNTSTKNNFDWVFTLIPKQVKDYITGTIFCTLPINLSETQVTITTKKLSITNTKITGHDMNAPEIPTGSNYNADVVLRYVFCV